jgi:hypothetical protein
MTRPIRRATVPIVTVVTVAVVALVATAGCDSSGATSRAPSPSPSTAVAHPSGTPAAPEDGETQSFARERGIDVAATASIKASKRPNQSSTSPCSTPPPSPVPAQDLLDHEVRATETPRS